MTKAPICLCGVHAWDLSKLLILQRRMEIQTRRCILLMKVYHFLSLLILEILKCLDNYRMLPSFLRTIIIHIMDITGVSLQKNLQAMLVFRQCSLQLLSLTCPNQMEDLLLLLWRGRNILYLEPCFILRWLLSFLLTTMAQTMTG